MQICRRDAVDATTLIIGIIVYRILEYNVAIPEVLLVISAAEVFDV